MLDESEMRIFDAQESEIRDLRRQLGRERQRVKILNKIVEALCEKIKTDEDEPDMPPMPFHPFTLKNGGDR